MELWCGEEFPILSLSHSTHTLSSCQLLILDKILNHSCINLFNVVRYYGRYLFQLVQRKPYVQLTLNDKI